jgi:hypothetical protein
MKSIPQQWADLTPSDTTLISPAIGLYIGLAGVVKAAGQDGVVGSFQAQAGQYLIGNFTKILATGTTASEIVVLY